MAAKFFNDKNDWYTQSILMLDYDRDISKKMDNYYKDYAKL